MCEDEAHPPARKLARQLHHLTHPLPQADMPLRPGPFRHQLLHLGVEGTLEVYSASIAGDYTITRLAPLPW
jgi:hypothetical protein